MSDYIADARKPLLERLDEIHTQQKINGESDGLSWTLIMEERSIHQMLELLRSPRYFY
ncbi:hypothetical protein [Sansalvadorimonas verongulae]|uniref:hypothetical protein n=1 Tax=Sansalvadorimonas verongulae TaxID=2172824 RepID=UPI0012BD45A4|nr:hypothetical protein [Sansalvadorimonas verongulae]